MKTIIFTLTIVTLTSTTLHAARNFEYRYQNAGNGIYKCVNQNMKEGYNPGRLGECGQVNGKSFQSPTSHIGISGLQSIAAKYETADFSGSSLHDCNFSKADMKSANLKSILIRKSNFNGADLTRASAKGALLIQDSLKGANLSYLKWTSASLSQVDFAKARLNSSGFDSALLTDVNFQDATLKSASFNNASLTDVDFRNADLRGVDFTDVLLGNGMQWKGAKYDNSTKLPFTEEKAAQLGMLKE